MLKIEYLILDSVVKRYETLKNVASECQLSKNEVALAATRLFHNGDILGGIYINEQQFRTNLSLGALEIQAHLDGKFNFYYYLTPQGGAKWEALSHPDWNFYHQWRFYENHKCEIICQDMEIIKQLLSFSYFHSKILIPETEIWDELEPWQATYWKNLPKAHRVRYQSRTYELLLDSQESIEAYNEKKCRYFSILQWYKYPANLEQKPYILFSNTQTNYYPTVRESNPKVEYLILKMAVINSSYGLSEVAYSEHFSDSEIVVSAHSLFERGDIRAKVFADEYDQQGSCGVILTKAGIQDHLNGKLRLSYYLTPQGGAHWEAWANPNWENFVIINFRYIFPYEEGFLGTKRENLENLLAIDKFILTHQHIPGTEVWEVKEPWQATYWKTLPRGYHVHFQYEGNDLDWDLSTTPAKIFEEYEEAVKWYTNLKNWFTDPQF